MQKLQISKGSLLVAFGAVIALVITIAVSFYFRQCVIQPVANAASFTATLTTPLQLTVNGVTVPLHITAKNTSSITQDNLRLGYDVYYSADAQLSQSAGNSQVTNVIPDNSFVLVSQQAGESSYSLAPNQQQEAVLLWEVPRTAPSGFYKFVPFVYANSEAVSDVTQFAQYLQVRSEQGSQAHLKADYTFDQETGVLNATVTNPTTTPSTVTYVILEHDTTLISLNRVTQEVVKKEMTIPAQSELPISYTLTAKDRLKPAAELIVTSGDFSSRILLPIHDVLAAPTAGTTAYASCVKKRALTVLWVIAGVLIMSFAYFVFHSSRRRTVHEL